MYCVIMDNMSRIYLAVALHDGTWRVAEMYSPTGDCHPIGDCRAFNTFEDANECAERLAKGEFPEIRPAGIYVNNR